MNRPRNTATPAQKRQLERLIRTHNTSRQKLIQGIQQLHRDGVSIRELAELTNRSTNTIQRWLKTP